MAYNYTWVYFVFNRRSNIQASFYVMSGSDELIYLQICSMLAIRHYSSSQKLLESTKYASMV